MDGVWDGGMCSSFMYEAEILTRTGNGWVLVLILMSGVICLGVRGMMKARLCGLEVKGLYMEG